MEADERKDSDGGTRREEREEREDREESAPRRWRERSHDGGEERPPRDRRRDRSHDEEGERHPRHQQEDSRRRRDRDSSLDRPWRETSEGHEDGDRRRKEHRRGHRGGSRSRDPSRDPAFDSLASTDRKKKRVEEKEKQACTIFVGDLDPSSTAEQLTGLFKKFGNVLTAKIKNDRCYGFVTFDKRESAEAAIAAGQRQDGIDLLSNKQVYVSWALGSLPEWKKGIGGFTVAPGKDSLLGRNRPRKGVVKPSVLAAATAAAAAKAHAVLAGDLPPAHMDQGSFRGRPIVAYDDLL